MTVATIPAGALACAKSAQIYWSGKALTEAVAVAGAESTWNNAASADSPAALLAHGYITQVTYQELLPYTCPADDPNGDTSYGGWQINLSNIGILPYKGNCKNAAWLMASWSHGAQMAHALWLNSGFSPWTTYGGAAYNSALPIAAAAIAAIQAGTPAPTPPPTPVTLPPSPPVIGAAGLPPPAPTPTSPLGAVAGTAGLLAGLGLLVASRRIRR